MIEKIKRLFMSRKKREALEKEERLDKALYEALKIINSEPPEKEEVV